MYSLEYLPIARQDMVEIVTYVAKTLCNSVAATRLAEKLTEAAENLRAFPYAQPAYQPLRPLGREYRKLLVENYLMLYWVDEAEKRITIARVVYAKRNYGKLLK